MTPNQKRVRILVACLLTLTLGIGTIQAQIPYKKSIETIDINDFKGTMYLEDTFVLSTIYDGLANHTRQAYLRYDAYNDVFEMKKSLQSKEHTHLRTSSVVSITYGTRKFYYRSYTTKSGKLQLGYLEEICKIGDQVFYKKYGKELIMPKKAQTTYEQDIPGKIANKTYYVVGAAKELKANAITKKTILNYIPSAHFDEIKSYIKQSKLKFKTPDDLQQLAKYCVGLGL